MPLANYTF
jgi:hypothetical protein